MRLLLAACIVLAGLAGCAAVEPVHDAHAPCPTVGGPRGARLEAVPSMDLEPTALVVESMDAFGIEGDVAEPDVRSDGNGGEAWSWGRPGQDVWVTARVRDGELIVMDIFRNSRPYADGGAVDAVMAAVAHFGVGQRGDLLVEPHPVFTGTIVGAGRLGIEDMPFANATAYRVEPFLVSPPFTVALEETSLVAHRAAMCALAQQGRFMAASGLTLVSAHEQVGLDRVLERVYLFEVAECDQVRVRVDARSGSLVGATPVTCD